MKMRAGRCILQLKSVTTGCLDVNGAAEDPTAAVGVRTLPEWRGQPPWIKLYPAGAGASPDWCFQARGTTYDLCASSSAARSVTMGKIIERCAGIDVGKRFLLCCALSGGAHEEPRSKTLRFDTTVPALEGLHKWLREEGVTHVVMESMGSYWIPIFNILEDEFVVVLANPEEVKNRKGHKTDRKDSEHLADLLRHNHVRASYIPPKLVRDLRNLTRRRVQLMEDATRERNRVQNCWSRPTSRL